MQEFRPASLIADDTALAERFHDGDEEAVRSLIGRYGSAVTAVVTPTVGRERAGDAAFEVFVRAHRQPIAPDEDFGSWLSQIVADNVGSVEERRWMLAMATSSVDDAVRPRLRSHHLDGGDDLDEDLSRHELRLRRRLAHIGDTEDVLSALSNPEAWVEADPDLADRVLAAIHPDPIAEPDTGVEETVEDDETAPVDPDDRSTVTRLMRPALFGLVGGLVVLFVTIVALSAASGTPQQPNFTAQLVPTGAIVEVEGGEITVTERDAGIEIDLQAETLPRRAADTFYEGRLVLASGAEVSAGTFFEGIDVTLWAGAPLDAVVRFEVLARDLADPDDAGDVILKSDLPPS
ncbi:anti-sigma factor [Ilumatobacter nonamiensis]|uniref:anti-sigma factor n=1 Tax=Ilumatobacter nonamiensis TaxID=467093 RepID=UPI0003457BFE|nr:anti-sigma factor [Ilumatobacter nonamiensis]